ncbi:hypothetical protein [Oleispirillum naphthae]|uniref:hypothetical protein n=1 Tax=Oleispirillum naphthae TaxID=2838853 RepID=UPI0030825118
MPAPTKKCPRLRRLAKQYLFLEENGVKVYHVLHDRENYPLGYWYCLDPIGIPGGCTEEEHAVTFDVRDLPEEFRQGPMEILRTYEVVRKQCERDLHRAAIRRAIAAGFDILANQEAVLNKRWAEEAARQAAAISDDDVPF